MNFVFYVVLLISLFTTYLPCYAEENACDKKQGAEKECCKSCVEGTYKDGRSKLTDSGIGECNKEEDPSGDLCCCSPKK